MKARYQSVTVIAPARLHMGFIDLSGALGRHFGSIGLALNEINTRLTISAADSLQVSGPSAERALKCTRQFCQLLGVSDALNITIDNAIPEHIGLGSGTQMALAVGAALNAFYDLGLSVREIAQLSDRGARSGIGIGIFETGGLVVDGGRGPDTKTPPMVAQMAVPEDWRFILVFDQRGQGLHGEQEVSAFQQLPPFPQAQAERLCYLLLMQGLPALAECDLDKFGEVITSLQQAVGEHFAPVQGGVFTSPDVAAAMASLAVQGAVAIGQTSWGPTGFCAVANPQRAAELLAQLERQFAASPLSFLVASARNQTAEIILN
ncbi:beta-ribofuranosylaminobenzene 5'-phosphate synthase family protein [Methylomonas sp. MK1]|uniref:beta-ribofuranosylaminobenzene 5'-phosphate synthase family protein n=1 Tax=Methylomonas sp. MK1 TaxID=1131552 RepID=UPI0009DADDB9|nr:beta-ribofuranosylaminobenzene 5'-phosphate synthase family protein [Methylomonas sp. MK1]